MSEATALVTITFQGFIAVMLVYVLIQQRRISRILKALAKPPFMVPPQQIQSFGGTHSGEGQKRPYQ